MEGARRNRTNAPRQLFTDHEDALLIALVQIHGTNNWTKIAEALPGRTPRRCRDRWMDHLRPGRNTVPFTLAEEEELWDQVNRRGHRWKQLAALAVFAGRTAESLKNRWLVLSRRSRRFQPGAELVLDDEPEDSFGQFGAFGQFGFGV